VGYFSLGLLALTIIPRFGLLGAAWSGTAVQVCDRHAATSPGAKQFQHLPIE
jgi:hypothetical protein